MDTNFALNLPINSVSFGQVSVALLREVHKRGYEPSIFPIGQTDLSAQTNLSEDFAKWLNSCFLKGLREHKRNVPILKLWHLNGSLESYSDKQTLLTFHETDTLTPEEVNAAKNQHKVLLTSKQSVQVFGDYGLENIEYCPLGFDSANFSSKSKDYFLDGRVSFGLMGKLEPKRKAHAQIIKAWVKAYGNNPKFFLNCAIWNPLLKPEDNQNLINQIMSEASEGRKITNVQFLGFIPTNIAYNDFLNSNDVIIAGGNEGWGLPEFHSVAMGKHAVILNVGGYKSWATEKNSTLFSPNGKTPCYDGIFFHPNQPFNQGNFYTFSDDDLIKSCNIAIQKCQSNKTNSEGLKLQTEFSWDKTADIIFNHLNNI
jgi:hypothetical protein